MPIYDIGVGMSVDDIVELTDEQVLSQFDTLRRENIYYGLVGEMNLFIDKQLAIEHIQAKKTATIKFLKNDLNELKSIVKDRKPNMHDRTVGKNGFFKKVAYIIPECAVTWYFRVYYHLFFYKTYATGNRKFCYEQSEKYEIGVDAFYDLKLAEEKYYELANRRIKFLEHNIKILKGGIDVNTIDKRSRCSNGLFNITTDL